MKAKLLIEAEICILRSAARLSPELSRAFSFEVRYTLGSGCGRWSSLTEQSMRPNIPVLNGVEYAILLRCEEGGGRLALDGLEVGVDVLVELGLLKAVGGFLILTTTGTLFLANRRTAGDLYWAVVEPEAPRDIAFTEKLAM